MNGCDNLNLWWECPSCGGKVDFLKEVSLVFDDENGEADFDPKSGLWLHTIVCKCGSNWTISISIENKKEEILT